MKLIILIAIALLASAYNAKALGVVQDYLANDTIELNESAYKIYGIRIQNPTEEEIKVKLTYDKSLLKVIEPQEEDEYQIAPKSNRKIYFNVSAENLKRDDVYEAGFTVHQLAGSGPGVPVLIKIAKSFKVRVNRNPNKFYADDYYPYLKIGAVILICLYILYRLKFKKRGLKRKNR